jgi:sec-independent protein translocase protein TatA
MQIPLALFNSPQDWLIVGIIALLVFGTRRLPEFGRSLGKGIVEFKKGLKGLEDDVETSGTDKSEPAGELPRPPQRVTPAAPRFDNAGADKPATHS